MLRSHLGTVDAVRGRYIINADLEDENYILRSMVAHGMGVSILSDMVFRSWSLEGQCILRKPLSDRVPNMDTGIFWLRQTPTRPASRAIVDCICRGS